jgi:hypothetical protein
VSIERAALSVTLFLAVVTLFAWLLGHVDRPKPEPADPRAWRLEAEAIAMPPDFSSMRLTARGPDGQDHVVCLEYDKEGRVSVRKGPVP